MQKDELIQLHTFLYQIKTQLTEGNGTVEEEHSSYYELIDVTPYQIHKSKREHKLAVFTLSQEIACLLSNGNGDNSLEKISSRLEQIALRSMTEKERELYYKRNQEERELVASPLI